MIRERQNQILSKNPEMSNRLKIEAKLNIDGASVHVEASKYVDSDVLPLHANEVDTTRFFSTTLNGKIGMTCLIGDIVKQIRRDLQLLHKDQV